MKFKNLKNIKRKCRRMVIDRILLLLIAVFGFTLGIHAQVTIGAGIPPEKGAILDIKEKDTKTPINNVAGLENSTKGVLYPKVFLRDAAKLTPLYGGSDNGSGIWSDESTIDEKLKATGMVVYNVNAEALNMDEGLYMWQIDEWVKLNQDGAAVIRPVACSAIRISGSYVEKTPVDNNNYLEIDLDVTKKGSFVISALSGNGYSFYYAGVALQTGVLTVKVPAQGTPALRGDNALTFSGINLAPGCVPKITVQEMVAAYTVVCPSAVAQGQYYKGQSLTVEHKIVMYVNVSQPGSYNIYTETKNGISFKASGTFTNAGIKTVTLQGTGTPTLNEDFQLIIKANSTLGSAECTVPITIILPDMTYAIIGEGVWSWHTAAREDALSNANSGSFSPTGLLKIKSFKLLWNTRSASVAESNLRNGFNGKYPDIVLYFAYNCNPTSGLTTELLKYINAGGCVIYGSSDDTASAVNILMYGLFGIMPARTQTGGGDDNVYPIMNNHSDPIVNGTFGNLAGTYWGEDNASNNSVVMSSLPPNSVQICTAQSTSKPSINPAYSIVWYNENKNFVYFGDSTGASKTNTSDNAYPAIYNNNGIPISKFYGPSNDGYKRYVYNSALELNAIAYLLRRAAVSGINPH